MNQKLCWFLPLLFVCTAGFLSAQKTGFSISAGANVAFLSPQNQFAQPGAYLAAACEVGKISIGLKSGIYSADKQIQVIKTSDLNDFYHLNSIRGILSVGYRLFDRNRVSFTPEAGILFDRRNVNYISAYTTQADRPEYIASTQARQEVRTATGFAAGLKGRVALTRRIGVEAWLQWQGVPGGKQDSIKETVFKSDALVSGIGLYLEL